MGKRLAIAVVITLLVVLAGLFAQQHLFGVEATPLPTPVAIASVIPSPTATPIAAPRVVASDVQGEVERQRKSSSEDWTALKRGDELSQDDAVRTHEGGFAVLELGSAATVTVAEDSQVRVAEISRQTSRVRLESGRLAAVVHGREEDSSLKVEFEKNGAVIDAKGGAEFAAHAAGDDVEVASEKGKVSLEASGKKFDLAGGETSFVRGSSAPTKPQKIQASLFLHLNKNSKQQTVKTTVVKGESTPGTIVSVNGVKTLVGPDGKFETKVALRDGENKLLVRATDIRGKTTMAPASTIFVDTKPATVDGKVKWN